MRRAFSASTLFLAVIIVLIVTSHSDAQEFEPRLKHRYLSGGASLSVSGGEAYGSEPRFLQLDGSYGYFIRRNLTLGARLNFSTLSQEHDSILELGIGPQVQVFFKSIEDKMGMKGKLRQYLSGSFAYHWAVAGGGYAYPASSYHHDDTYSWVSGRVAAGLINMFSGSVGLQTELAYQVDFFERERGYNIGVVLGLVAFLD